MLTVNKIRDYCWTIDPGYFNLQLAGKTILAIVMSLSLTYDAPLLTKLMAGIASGFAIESIVTKTWYARLLSVAILSLAYFAAFALGLLVRDSANWTAVVLVVLGFVVNYMRRFGMDNSVAPMKVWILCFIATILPFAGAAEGWAHIYGVLTGLLVAAAIMFIFPDNYQRLFISNSNRFFKMLAQGMSDIRQYLLFPAETRDFQALPFVQLKIALMQLIDSNATMQQSMVFSSNEKQINSLLSQYALFNAYTLMVEAYCTLWRNKHVISQPSQRVLSEMNDQFAQWFSSLTMQKDYQVYSDAHSCFLTNLAKRLGQTPLSDPMLVMVLLNLKLSFDLFNQHIKNLLRNDDGA